MATLEKCLRSQTILECQAVQYGHLIGSPVLLLMGTVGNAWIAFVVTKLSLRKSPTAAFILALAVMDMVTLWTGVGRHFVLSLTGTDIRSLSPLACKSQRFVLYVAMDASATVLAAISADRFAAVWLPHARKFLTMAKARAAILALTSASVIFNMHVWWTRGEQVKFDTRKNQTIIDNCGYPSEEYERFWKRDLGWLAMGYFCIVPFTIMVVLNSLTVIKLRARRLAIGKTSANSFRLTFMLLCTTLFFIVITAPAFLYNAIKNMLGENRLKPGTDVLGGYATLIQYLNNAINFYLYILTGHGFRRDVRESLMRILPRKGDPRTDENVRECQTLSTSGSGGGQLRGGGCLASTSRV